jgi:very-short-patch-repair endonuclease
VEEKYTLDLTLVGGKKIDIEVDGSQHETVAGTPVIEDMERDKFLRKRGWVVLRFSNYLVLSEIDKVVQRIKDEL